MEAVDAKRHVAFLRRNPQMVRHVNAPHHEDVALLFDLAHHV